jgi:hypothetical protein
VTVDEKKRRITEEKLDFCLLKAENRKASRKKERPWIMLLVLSDGAV